MTANAQATSTREADVVLIGGGSAGCIVARRLAEADPSLRVVLLEAGGAGTGFLVDTPGMTVRLMGNPQSDWLYPTEPDPTAAGRTHYWSGGRMLGGSSGINGLVYIRGLQRDYDTWADMGCSGWGWRDIEPFFRRAEGFEDDGHPSLGSAGPYAVSKIRSLHPLTQRFVEGCAQLGIPAIDDYNAGCGEGAFVNLTSQSRGRRSSTGNRYLASGQRPQNLQVITDALVERIIFEGKRASAVLAKVGDRLIEFQARVQIVLCAGTVQSPAILMRSGVGPAEHLRERSISVLLDAPEVGANLQEHSGLTISKFVNLPTYNSESSGLPALRHLLNYLFFRKGALASAAVQGMGWAKSDSALSEPDIHLNWLPYGIDYTVAPPTLHSRPAVSLGVCVSRPYSRGHIRLKSAAAMDKPIITHRLLDDMRDVETIKRGIALMEKIFASRALQSSVIGACDPPAYLSDNQALEDFIRSHVGIGYHGVGSCRMGADAASVVDPQLRVRGVESLRIIDASIMPRIVSANTNAASIMIGEKGAEALLDDLRRRSSSAIDRSGVAA